MRKAIFTNFRFFFALILILHLTMLFLQLHEKSRRKDEVTELKVRILKELGLKSRRQIVESEDPLTETIPKENPRLSDKDRAFDRETRAQIVEKFQKSTKGQQGKKDVSLSALGGDIGQKNPLERAAKEYSAQKSGSKTEANGRTISSTNDYLEDVPLGELTHLNTVEYKFYGYYHRIKQKLEGFWGRSIQEKAEAMAQEGRYLVDDQHITALRIVMNHEGEIIEVVILGSSGVKELDDAAIESFNAAGPFPNPPKDLIVGGRVTIEWGFVVNS
jgi:TonB family protein